MTDFSNSNNMSPFSGKLNADLSAQKAKSSQKPDEAKAPATPEPVLPSARSAKSQNMPADTVLKNMENHALAWITTGQNPELNPVVARIVQEVLFNLPSQEAVMTVYKKALTSVSEEFGWNEEDPETQTLAEEVTADLLIGRPVVRV